jgi:protoporphyrinogen oxidase
MAKKRILILGAGLAGLSAVWHLQSQGIDCQIFEKESDVGGLCRSKNIDGFIFDYDGHLLHFKQDYAFNLIKNLLGDSLVEHQRNAWIYSYDRYSRYPFQANLYGLPLPIIKDCLLGFIRASKNGKPDEEKNLNFSSWINHTFGKGIAKYFMLPYNTKFWTLPPKALTCEWLDGFIPVPSLNEIVDGTIEESKRQFGYSARFWYPKRGGISEVSKGLASSVKNINTNCQITEIDIRKKEIKTASGRERYDFLISTIPLPELAYLVKGMPNKICSLFKKLRWNSIFNLNLGIERKDYFGRHWVYFPEKDFCFFRIGFFHNFSPYLAPQDKSSLYVEVSYSKYKPIDKSNIILKIREDLNKAGILTAQDKICIQDINDIKYGYPIYDKNYRRTREEILRYLVQNNIFPCGRYGSWRYMSMEDVIVEGRDVADRMLQMV